MICERWKYEWKDGMKEKKSFENLEIRKVKDQISWTFEYRKIHAYDFTSIIHY